MYPPPEWNRGDRFEDAEGEPQHVDCVIAGFIYYRTESGLRSISTGAATWLPSEEDQKRMELEFIHAKAPSWIPPTPKKRIRDEIDIALTFRPSSEQLEATPERQSGRI